MRREKQRKITFLLVKTEKTKLKPCFKLMALWGTVVPAHKSGC